LFGTRAFDRLRLEYRDAALTALEADGPVPTLRRSATGLAPAEYRELRGQVATFDAVAPCLAVLFEACDRSLSGAVTPAASAEVGYAATAPAPVAERSTPTRLEPTMVDSVPDRLAETIAAIRSFHGFEDSLPSVYRCLAQWPGYLDPAWERLGPRLRSDAFDRAVDRTGALVDELVTGAAHRPRLDPPALRSAGFDDTTITDAAALFRRFNTGPVETVLPALPVWAATVGSDGPRR
jgi:hypothetical protein